MQLLFEGGSYLFIFKYAISVAIIQGRLLFGVRLLFEGSYYLGCGYFSNKYSMYVSAVSGAYEPPQQKGAVN